MSVFFSFVLALKRGKKSSTSSPSTPAFPLFPSPFRLYTFSPPQFPASFPLLPLPPLFRHLSLFFQRKSDERIGEKKGRGKKRKFCAREILKEEKKKSQRKRESKAKAVGSVARIFDFNSPLLCSHRERERERERERARHAGKKKLGQK